MKSINFIKENFINALTSSINNIEEAENVFKKIFSEKENISKNISKGTLYNLVNRKEYLKETCQALNSNDQRLIFISGFQGTGKTEFINTLIHSLDENILNFYYECSVITHLDDVILSLFNFLKKMLIKTPEYKRAFKISSSQSIDERLMNYIKSLNRPLLIAIDSFENLINDEISDEYKELIHFLEFLSSFPEIKIIISGRKVNSFNFKKQENIYEIKLGGLDEQESYKILKDNGLIETESGLQQIYHVSRGYPENLLWFLNAVNTLQINAFDLMQEYYSQEQNSFEEFIYKKIYKSVNSEFLRTICFFASIRHSVTIENLEKLNFTLDIGEKINYLLSRMILTQNKDVFYIKNLLKNIIYSNISLDEKKQIHRYFYELYSEQISKKLEERIFRISRKLLYSEQYYHYMCLINYGDKSLSDIKTTTLLNIKPDFKYLYTNINDNLFTKNKENETTVLLSDQREREDLKTIKGTDSHVALLAFQNDKEDDKIELSEEEKALLEEENNVDTNLHLSHAELDSASVQQGLKSVIEKSQTLKPVQVDNSKTLTGLEKKAKDLKSEANIFYEERKFDKSIEKLKEALILYENFKDKKNINFILLSIANVYNECFQHDIALTYYYKILNSKDNNVEAKISIEAFCGMADIYNYREDFENALKFYQKAFKEAKTLNDIIQKAKICFKKALLYDDFGDFDMALEFYFKNIAISQDIKINPDIAASYANIAAIYEEREDLNKAKEYYSESLKFDKIMNNKEGQYETFSNIGNIYFELMDYQNADDCFHEALEIAKQINDSYKIAMSCLDIGDIHLQKKYYEKALKTFIIAGKTIEKTISTDSKEKIDRRFKKVISEIGEHNFKQIIEKLKKKHE